MPSLLICILSTDKRPQAISLALNPYSAPRLLLATMDLIDSPGVHPPTRYTTLRVNGCLLPSCAAFNDTVGYTFSCRLSRSVFQHIPDPQTAIRLDPTNRIMRVSAIRDRYVFSFAVYPTSFLRRICHATQAPVIAKRNLACPSA